MAGPEKGSGFAGLGISAFWSFSVAYRLGIQGFAHRVLLSIPVSRLRRFEKKWWRHALPRGGFLLPEMVQDAADGALRRPRRLRTAATVSPHCFGK